jgi:hypothetical protein
LSGNSRSGQVLFPFFYACLLIPYVKSGCEIRFYALLTLGPRSRIISLIPSISHVKGASDGLERKALHRTFFVASVLHYVILNTVNTFPNLGG